MKKSAFIVNIIFSVFSILNTQAQDYLINFTGTGDATKVNSVKVSNLTSGDTVTLNGGNFLHLKAVLGIDEIDFSVSQMKIYPNPMIDKSSIAFYAQEYGSAVISIIDLTGKIVCQISKQLPVGKQSFQVSGISPGIYFVNVAGENYTYNEKLVSQNYSDMEADIKYVENHSNNSASDLKSTSATIDMQYTEGDQLLFKGKSGIYTTFYPDKPTGSKTINFNFVKCQDSDGNNYTTVQIGTQTWMAENLNYHKNGLFYDNDINYSSSYGRLYNWFAAREASPPGWHLPEITEWETLINYSGDEDIAGGKLKSTEIIDHYYHSLWFPPNYGANNEFGFSALPGGIVYMDGTFGVMHWYGYYWSSTRLLDHNSAWMAEFSYDNQKVGLGTMSFEIGLSIRCVKD